MMNSVVSPWPLKWVAAIVLSLLGGCASTKVEEQQSDSPMPASLLNGQVKTCAQYLSDGTGHKQLKEGDQCLALVRADAWLSNTGLPVRKGEVYRMTVADGQFWFDATRRNQAPAGDPGSQEMNEFQSWKRHPDSMWFALMAATLPPALRDKQSEALDLCAQDLSADSDLLIAHDGELVLYPNDARLPLVWPKFFYGNNHGQIWVFIRRIK